MALGITGIVWPHLDFDTAARIQTQLLRLVQQVIFPTKPSPQPHHGFFFPFGNPLVSSRL